MTVQQPASNVNSAIMSMQAGLPASNIHAMILTARPAPQAQPTHATAASRHIMLLRAITVSRAQHQWQTVMSVKIQVDL